MLWFFSRWRDTWPRRNRTRSPFASASCVQFLESHIPTGCSFIFISFSRRLRRRIIIKPWFGLIFNGRLPLSSTELILLFFIAIAWTVEFFSFSLFYARYTQPSKNHSISPLTQPTAAISWKDCGFCNYLFVWRISVIFIIYLQAPKLSKPHRPNFD